MRRMKTLAAVPLALMLCTTVLAQARRPAPRANFVRFTQISVPDEGVMSVRDALSALGLRMYYPERLFELNEQQKDKLIELALDVRDRDLDKLADVLGKPGKDMLLNYLDNAPEFGPDLGFMNLSEIQKVKIRRLLTAYREQTRGQEDPRGNRSHYNPAERRALYLYSRAVLEVLTDEQKELLKKIQGARSVQTGYINRNDLPEDLKIDDDVPAPMARPVYDSTMSTGKVVEVDAKAMTMKVIEYARRGYLYHNQTTVCVVDRKVVTPKDLLVQKPLLAFFTDNSGSQYMADAIVQQTDKAVHSLTGKVGGAVAGGKLPLTNALLDGVAIDDKTVVLDTSGKTVEAARLQAGQPVWLAVADLGNGPTALTIRCLTEDQMGFRTTSAILIDIPEQRGNWTRPLTVRDSLVGKEIELAIDKGFYATDYAGGQHNRLDLATFAEKYVGKDQNILLYYRRAKDDEKLPTAAFGQIIIWGRR